MSHSIFDLVKIWEPRDCRGRYIIYAFRAVPDIQGWAHEDGHTLHLIEVWNEDMNMNKICLFMGRTIRHYERVVVEVVRGDILAIFLVQLGFTYCSVRSYNPDYDWVGAMVWSRNMPSGINEGCGKGEAQMWIKRCRTVARKMPTK
jgi:hypothetical protein